MSDMENSSSASGVEAPNDEDEVDEIRLGPLLDELSSVMGKDFSREEMIQAILNNRFDLKSAIRYLKREPSLSRQSPDKAKRGHEENVLVDYQLPLSFCRNSAIFIEGRKLERLPLHKMIREWLTEILRKRSRQKREEEKTRYFRSRNESQCSEDSVVTTSGESQDVLGDTSQDLSEDSQDMAIDYFDMDTDKNNEKVTENSKVESHWENIADKCTLGSSSNKEETMSTCGFPTQPSEQRKSLKNSAEVNTLLSSIGKPDPNSFNFSVPKLKIPPLSVGSDNMNMKNSEQTFQGDINANNNIGSIPSLRDFKQSNLTSSVGQKGPSLTDLANSSLTGSGSNLNEQNTRPSLSMLANASLGGNNTGLPSASISSSLSAMTAATLGSSGSSFSALTKSSSFTNSGPSLAALANSGNSFSPLANSEPRLPPLVKTGTGTSLSSLANSCLGGTSIPINDCRSNVTKSSETNNISGSPSLSSLASSYLSSGTSITSIPPLGLGKSSEMTFTKSSNGLGNFDIPMLKTSNTSAANENSKQNMNIPNLVTSQMSCKSRDPSEFHETSKGMTNMSLSQLANANRVVESNSFQRTHDSSILSSLENLALCKPDFDIGMENPLLRNVSLQPGLRPPPGFEHVKPMGGLPEKECLETILRQEEGEVDIHAEIDLQTALMKPQAQEEMEQETSAHSGVLVIDPPMCRFKFDPSLQKHKPSSFGRVMVNVPKTPNIKRLTEKVIQVPFKIFKFDTPSPDELIQEALQNKMNPGWYKLVTKERLSRRHL